MENSKIQEVYNLIILDESGSMESIKNSIIIGFNELAQNIKGIAAQFPEQKHFVTFVTFNGLGLKELFYNNQVDSLKLLDAQNYIPDSMTPLYDAIGTSVLNLKHDTFGKDNVNVLVTILTDGEENASKEFSGKEIRTIIEQLKEKNWTFTYIGTEHNVEGVAINLSIPITNTLIFNKTVTGVKTMFEHELTFRKEYNRKVRDREDTKENFFKQQ